LALVLSAVLPTQAALSGKGLHGFHRLAFFSAISKLERKVLLEKEGKFLCWLSSGFLVTL